MLFCRETRESDNMPRGSRVLEVGDFCWKTGKVGLLHSPWHRGLSSWERESSCISQLMEVQISKQASKQTKTRLKELRYRHLLPSLMTWVWSLEHTLWKERTDSCKPCSDNTSSKACGEVGTSLHTYEKRKTAQLLWKEFCGCSKSTYDLATHCWIYAARTEIYVHTKPCTGCSQLCYIK